MAPRIVKSSALMIFFALAGALETFALEAEYGGAVLKRAGSRIVGKDGVPLLLKGVAFGNEVWSNNPFPTNHHDAVDYHRIAKMGMNAVRFYLNYRTFESDAKPFVYQESGFAWLDSNIAWAKAAKVYLILNIHVPQGGFQSLGEGLELWNKPTNQDRLTSLWHALSKRYAQETVIAAYDLLNEPVTSVDRKQWQDLAQRLVDTIRTVDKQHIIMVERTNAPGKKWDDVDENANFFLVKDDNFVPTFHFYSPFEFTHQLASWLPESHTANRYPDSSQFSVAGTAKWAAVLGASPALPSTASDWTTLQTPVIRVTDTSHKLIVPVFEAALVSGEAWIDDALMEVLDKDGQVIEKHTFDFEKASGWYFWSENGKGVGALQSGAGIAGTSAFRVSGTTSNANLSGGGQALRVMKDRGYRLSAKVRALAPGIGSSIRLRFDANRVDGAIFSRDKFYLEAELDRYIRFGRKHQLPLYLGEFGTISHSFVEDRGGIRWVEDMLNILAQSNVHFTYHTYHEDAFGIYPGYGKRIDTTQGRQDLIALFTRKLPLMTLNLESNSILKLQRNTRRNSRLPMQMFSNGREAHLPSSQDARGRHLISQPTLSR